MKRSVLFWKRYNLRHVLLLLCFISFGFYMYHLALSNKSQASDEYIPILFLFSRAKEYPRLSKNLRTTVSSIIKFTSVGIDFYIYGDMESYWIAERMITDISRTHKAKVKISYLDLGNMTEDVHYVLRGMQKLFSSTQKYYSHSLFTISIAIHRILPSTMQRIIMLDTDLKFNADIQHLYNLFSYFNESNVIGIGREKQPIYRRAFSKYRAKHPGTRVGDPPPHGLTGFNSGVLLLHLDHMRKSKRYNYYLDIRVARNLTKKYFFHNTLGDQDFYSLLQIEDKELFYVLPCSWNRQLCRYHHRRYPDVFQNYFECLGHINVYHGNCKMEIPMLDWERKHQDSILKYLSLNP